MWYKEKFFKYAVGTLIVLLIIYMMGKMDVVVEPIKKFLLVLFAPLMIAGFFYYLLRPLVRIAVRYHIPRGLAILGSFLMVIGVLAAISSYAGTLLWKQLSQFVNDSPQIAQTLTEKVNKFINDNNLEAIVNSKLQQQIESFAQELVPFFQNSIMGVVSTFTNVLTIALTIPFILYYMLKDDNKMSKAIMRFVPSKYEKEVAEILDETDKTLSDYITGKVIIALILGVLMLIGYMIIGLKYAFILALFVVLTQFIPMFGAFIGIIPAGFVALAESPMMVLKVLIIMVIATNLEGNLISPLFIGKRMDIHPLTLILLFLVASALYGFIGMLIAVPTYAVFKILLKGAYKIYLVRKEKPVESQAS
ncbi:MAG TPA: AI-2E family transporter [Clostridia bacterium]|nr:AI-2E family transporter [Clostridia bacterium]